MVLVFSVNFLWWISEKLVDPLQNLNFKAVGLEILKLKEIPKGASAVGL